MTTYVRDMRVFGEYNEDVYREKHLRRFEDMCAEALQFLVDEGYARTDRYHNNAPSIGQILAFMNAFEGVTAHGFMKMQADDVTVEGVEYHGRLSTLIMLKFVELFRCADEFYLNVDHDGTLHFYAWFD